MTGINRRVFLANLGCGVLASTVDPTLFLGGRVERFANEADPRPLHFGARERLVCLMQETEADKLLPVLVKELRSGTKLEDLVAAGALANARTFGGVDYDGYHVMMALVPSLVLASHLGAKDAPLAVLKVLVRNTARIQKLGGRSREALAEVEGEDQAGASTPTRLVEASYRKDVAQLDKLLAAAARQSPEEAYRSMQPLVREHMDVHQIVLSWRAWDLLRLTGSEHALTMLRVPLRSAFDREQTRISKGWPVPPVRVAIPKIVDAFKLDGVKLGVRRGDEAWIATLAETLFRGSNQAGAEAVAAAIRDGFHQDDIGESLSLASTRLLLHDVGAGRGSDGKPIGSVHGASVGVHASDSAHAWRHIARAVDPDNAVVSLIAAGWHTAGQSQQSGQEPFHASAREAASRVEEHKLLDALATSVRDRDQRMAAALAERISDVAAAKTRLLPSYLENDGALHHEKYFTTQADVLRSCGPARQREHLAALARVAASGCGFQAPAVQRARELLAT